MINKFTLLCGVYRYNTDYNKVIPKEEVIKDFLHIDISDDLEFIQSLKFSLEDNYGISNKANALEWISDLQAKHNKEAIIYSLLIQLYFEDKEKGLPLKILLNKVDVKKLTIHHLQQQNLDHINLEEQEQLLHQLANTVNDFIDKVNIDFIRDFFAFIKNFETIAKRCMHVGFQGFDDCRSVSILTSAHNVGYIDTKQTLELLNQLGEDIQPKYQNWETYLSSCILGKMYMMHGTDYSSNSYIITEQSFIEQTYGMLISPNDLFELDPIWNTEHTYDLIEDLKTLFKHLPIPVENDEVINDENKQLVEFLKRNKTTLSQHNKSCSVFEQMFLPIAKKYQVESYFYQQYTELNFARAEDDSTYLGYFWPRVNKFIDKYKLQLNKEEIPIFASKKFLFTTKKIYYLKGGMFSKKLKIKNWEDLIVTTDLDFTTSYLQLYIDNVNFAEIDLDSKRANTTKSLTSLSKEEVNHLYEQDFIGLIRTFKDFGKILNK